MKHPKTVLTRLRDYIDKENNCILIEITVAKTKINGIKRLTLLCGVKIEIIDLFFKPDSVCVRMFLDTFDGTKCVLPTINRIFYPGMWIIDKEAAEFLKNNENKKKH